MADHEEHHEEGGGHKSHGGGGHGAHGGGGGHEEGHEGAPEWLISFADNVALLMGFFVILLAMNMKEPQAGGIGGKEGPNTPPPTKQWLDMVLSIRESFHNPVDMNSTDPRDAPLRKRKQEKLAEEAGTSVRPGSDGDKHDSQGVRPSDYVVPTALVQFELTSADLTESALAKARDAAKILAGRQDVIIEVRGHVSAAEVRRDRPGAYKLSHNRALAVANVLAEQGVPWRQLRLVACAENSPLKHRADNAGDLRTNQRAEIVIIQERAEPDEFADNASANVAEPPSPH